MNDRTTRRLKSAALWVVGFHFLSVVLHSIAHEVLKVKATAAQLAFIIPVIIFAPVAAGFMLPKRHGAGSALLLASMAGSFVFGLYYHFVADTIDHVAHVARMEPAFWSSVFRVTAWLLLVSEALGVAVAALALAGRPRPFKHYAARTGF
ncbi:MAG TPA: hypothetical protein VGV38_13770 [Pyrinomonadaceae bacterium]|nr:hypothetical protein [Pyrinomonadaceae bacterium]